MTTREDISGGTVDQLLLDAGHLDVPDLRAVLLSIASLAQMQAPAPGPELAAMLAGPRDEMTRQRWLRKHRPAVVGLAVLAGMGLGVSGVAATSQVSGGSLGSWSVQQLTSDWTPGWTLPLPPSAVGDRPAGWASPLFLQLDRADPPSAHGTGKPATQTAGPEDTAVEPAPPAASGDDQVQSPVNRGRAHSAASTGNPGHGSAGKANPAKANPAKAVPGQPSTGRTQDQADEQDADVTPDAGETSAGETADVAPSSERTRAGKSGVKLDSAVESAIDSTVDPALDSVNSWLGKFRR